MPKKICKVCNASVGVRTLVCSCGNAFKPSKVTEVSPPALAKATEKISKPAPTQQKIVKDPEAELRKEADDLAFSIKQINSTGLLRNRFFVRKTVNNIKYAAIFTEAGKITGMYEYA